MGGQQPARAARGSRQPQRQVAELSRYRRPTMSAVGFDGCGRGAGVAEMLDDAIRNFLLLTGLTRNCHQLHDQIKSSGQVRFRWLVNRSGWRYAGFAVWHSLLSTVQVKEAGVCDGILAKAAVVRDDSIITIQG